MKKLFFTLLSSIVIFGSCSSDNDMPGRSNVDGGSSEKIYTVNFDITGAGLKVNKNPLRSLTAADTFLQIVAYKETGEVYSDTVLTPTVLSNLLTEDGSLPLSLNLPAGNYRLAFMHTAYMGEDISENIISSVTLKPVNFFSDLYGGGTLGSIMGSDGSNSNNYYQSINVSVFDNNQHPVAVVLEPMWSSVTITVEDPKTFIAPPNAAVMRLDVDPSYHMYRLSTKLAEVELYHDVWDQKVMRIDDMREMETASVSYNISKTTPENNGMKLRITFYEVPVNGYDNAFILERVIDLNTQVENGNHYNISGKLGDLSSPQTGGQMGITIGSFNPEDVIIEF